MFATIALDDSTLGGDLNSAESRFQKFGGAVGGVLGKIAVGFGGLVAGATTAFGAIAKKAFDLSADLEQSSGGIETIFGDEAAKKVIANAEMAFKTAGLNANQYMETVTGFSASLISAVGGDTGKAVGIADMAIRDMSDNANKFGTSMESLQATYVNFGKGSYAMLDNLKLGYSGSKEEMQRLLKDAQAFNKEKYGIDKVFDITKLDDVYSAINLVQQKFNITGATALEASTTVAGSIGMLKASFDNLLMGSGSVDAFVESFQSALGNILRVSGEVLPRLTEAFPKIFDALAPMIPTSIEQVVPLLLDGGMSLIGGLVNGIAISAPFLLTEMLRILQELATNIVTGATPFIESGKGLIDGFIANFMASLPNVNETGKSLIDTIFKGISDTIPKIVEKAVPLIDGFVNAIKTNLPKLLTAGYGFIIGITEGITQKMPSLIVSAGNMTILILKTISEKLPQFIKWAVDMVQGIADKIKEKGPTIAVNALATLGALLVTIISKLPEFLAYGVNIIGQIINGIAQMGVILITTVGTLIWDTLDKIGTTLLDGIDSIIQSATKIGNEIINGIIQGVTDMADKAVTAVQNVATNIVEGAKSLLKIHSPSKLFEDEVGAMIPAGMAVGITKKEKLAIKAAEQMATKTYSSAKTWIEDYRNDTDYLASQELEMWEALAKKYTAVSKQKVEIDKNIARLREVVANEEFEASKKWIEKRKFFDLMSIEEEIDALTRMSTRYAEGSAQREEIDRSLYTAKKALIAETEQAEQKALDEEKKALEEQKRMAKEQEDLYKNQADLVNKITDAENKYKDAVNARADAIFNAYGLFDEVKKEEAMTAQQMTDNLKGQVTALRDWTSDLEKLRGRGLDAGFISQLEQLGPNEMAQIDTLSKMSESGLDNYVKLWKEKQELARVESVKEHEKMRTEINQEIDLLLQDLAKTVDSDSVAIGKSIADGILKGFKENAPKLPIGVDGKATGTSTGETKTNTMTDLQVASSTTSINIDSLKGTMDSGFTSITESVVSKLGTMLIESNKIIDKLMITVENTLRVKGFDIGRVFMKSLGDALIAEKAYLLAEALAVADAITEIFNQRQNELIRHGGEPGYVPSWEKGDTATAPSQNNVEQNLYFYGVKEEQTAFEVQQALRRESWEALT